MALVFRTPPLAPEPDRLPTERLAEMRRALEEVGLTLSGGPTVCERLQELRGMYEPFVFAMSRFLLFQLPPIMPTRPTVDNWQTSAWMRRVPGIAGLRAPEATDEHFV
jgi:hypothetical protein